jgi:hypothetical protein
MRLKQIFISSPNGFALGMRYMMIFMSIAYGTLYGYLMNLFAKKNPITGTTLDKINAGLLLFAIASFVIKNYFPRYIGSTRFISTIYPVSASKRALGHLINDLTSSLFIAFGLFYLLFVLNSDALSWHYTPALIAGLFAWILADRNLRRALDFKLISNSLHTTITIGFMGVLALLLFAHFGSLSLATPWLGMAYAAFVVILFIHGLWIDASILETQEWGHNREDSDKPPQLIQLLLQYSWNNSRVRSGYLTAFGLKIFLALVGLFIGARSKEGGLAVLDIYQYLILSPFFVIAQLFMNTFGFYRDFWLAGELYGKSRMDMMKVWITFMAVLVPFDIIISFGLMATVHSYSWQMLLFYLISLPVMVSISLKASFKSPIYMETLINTGSSNNVGVMGHALLIMLMIGVFGALTYHGLIWTMAPVVGVWLYFDLKKWPKIVAEKGATVYDKLFK